MWSGQSSPPSVRRVLEDSKYALLKAHSILIKTLVMGQSVAVHQLKKLIKINFSMFLIDLQLIFS